MYLYIYLPVAGGAEGRAVRPLRPGPLPPVRRLHRLAQTRADCRPLRPAFRGPHFGYKIDIVYILLTMIPLLQTCQTSLTSLSPSPSCLAPTCPCSRWWRGTTTSRTTRATSTPSPPSSSTRSSTPATMTTMSRSSPFVTASASPPPWPPSVCPPCPRPVWGLSASPQD